MILTPSAADRYQSLKAAVLQRLAASPDLQLHQLLNEVRLDGRTPSQLLRHMRRLAGAAISDDALKVKWLHLLPPYSGQMCRVLKVTSLDELATLADQLITSESSVHAVSRHLSPSPTPSSGVSTGTTTPVTTTQELTALRVSVVQLVSMLQKPTTLH